MEKIPVKLQHGTSNFWGVIAFTRSFDLGLDWKLKKFTHAIAEELLCSKGTLILSKFESSNLSKILMWRILVSSYNLIQAIDGELSRSQGPSRCCLLESLKRSHKGQDQTLLKFWWEHATAHPPRQWQYPSSLRGGGVKIIWLCPVTHPSIYFHARGWAKHQKTACLRGIPAPVKPDTVAWVMMMEDYIHPDFASS